jgi:hypothetical protein
MANNDPFSAYRIPPRPIPNIPPAPTPPRFVPSTGTPSRVTVREQGRAESLPDRIASNQAVPRYGDAPPARPPFPAAGDRAAQPGVPVVKPSTAGGK